MSRNVEIGIDSDWYSKIWDLNIKNSSWTEDTVSQVDFLIDLMQLKGNERILDMACGYGRHALEFSRRGYEVVGVDITEAYIDDAIKSASAEDLTAQFHRMDLRDIDFYDEFDVVLNLADGAIGYLENEEENLKIFQAVSRALKCGGKHFMDICNADHAALYFPKRHWEMGKKSISLPEFKWLPQSRRMLYGGLEIPLGEVAAPIEDIPYHSSTRLYSLEELTDILKSLNMRVLKDVTDYSHRKSSEHNLQLQVYSVKE